MSLKLAVRFLAGIIRMARWHVPSRVLDGEGKWNDALPKGMIWYYLKIILTGKSALEGVHSTPCKLISRIPRLRGRGRLRPMRRGSRRFRRRLL